MNYCSCGFKDSDDQQFENHIAEDNNTDMHVVCSETEHILYEHIRVLEKLILELDEKFQVLQTNLQKLTDTK